MRVDATDPVVVIDGARTPIGTFGKAFKNVPTAELGAIAIGEAIRRVGIPPESVDEVVLGCVGQVGPEAFNARRAALKAGIPASKNAYNVNRLCASGLQAIWSGATELLTEQAEIVVAGGNENMTVQPFLDYGARDGYALGHRRLIDGTLSLVTDPWGDYPMGVTGEAVARRFGITREDQDHFALRSQQRAGKAIDSGLFEPEIVPVPVKEGKTERIVARDEHPRPDVTLEKLGSLRPAFEEDGTVTAGNSSGINDAGAAVVMMKESKASALGLTPLGRFVGLAKGALEPEIMGYAPTMAIERVLEDVGLLSTDLGVVELNEAFAAQVLAVIRDADLDEENVNPNGGAIALGHPVGATGAILTLKMLYHMRREQLEWGLVTMCIGGGQALAGVFQLAA